MANFIIKREERDFREAVPPHLRRKVSGMARNQEEALELTHRRGERPNAPLAFDDGGQAEREKALRAGISEESWERREWRRKKAREG